MAKNDKTTSALPDIMGPLNVNKGGDTLAPPNDMSDVGGKACHGGRPNDPMAFVSPIEGGKK
jgi:hypothetical protein